MVDVCMITYNHEKYIVEAIESVLKQVTSFPIRLIIGEDHSTDNTRKICFEYQQKYRDRITVVSGERNGGMMNNFIRTIQRCESKYVAFLEGDDYWTDPFKLQKQVDFLETNPGFSACFHNVTVKWTKNNTIREWEFHKKLDKDVYETEDLLCQWFIPSASVVFSNQPAFIFPDWFPHCKSGDIPFLLLLSLRGKLKYLNEILGVYRVHDQGLSSAHNGYDKIIAMIYIYENFNIHTKSRYKSKIREAIIYEIKYHFPDYPKETESKKGSYWSRIFVRG